MQITWLRRWIERRRLNREVGRFQKQMDAPSRRLFEDILTDYEAYKRNVERLDVIRTRELNKRAIRLGIVVHLDNVDWWHKEQTESEPALNMKGQVQLEKLIRDEKFANQERWIKLIASIIAALTGLIGTIIGLLALAR